MADVRGMNCGNSFDVDAAYVEYADPTHRPSPNDSVDSSHCSRSRRSQDLYEADRRWRSKQGRRR